MGGQSHSLGDVGKLTSGPVDLLQASKVTALLEGRKIGQAFPGKVASPVVTVAGVTGLLPPWGQETDPDCIWLSLHSTSLNPKLPLDSGARKAPDKDATVTHLCLQKAQILKQLKESLQSLEQDYLITKEKHRDIQLQSYKSGGKPVGEFDPNRMVEGEIFRLGMLLEDIKEKMDENDHSPSFAMSAVLDQSEPNSTSHAMLHENPVLLISNVEENKIEPEVIPLREGNEETIEGLQTELVLDKSKEQVDNCDLLSQQPKKVEDGGTGSRRSRHGRFAIVIQEEALNLDLSDSDFSSNSEDSLFSTSFITGSQSRKASACRSKSYRVHSARLEKHVPNLGYKYTRQERECMKLKEYDDFVLSCMMRRKLISTPTSYHCRKLTNNNMSLTIDNWRKPYDWECTKGLNNLKRGMASKIPSFSQRKNIFSPALHARGDSEERNGLVSNLPLRQNFVPGTHYSSIYNTFMRSPPYLTKRISGGRAMFNFGNKNEDLINNKILNSILDDAIQTANSMKEITERMVRAVSADLARAHVHRILDSG
ncbi:protein AKNAD1 [Rhinatrema bivittatum]|uniref:protein AKNAD1 n=1 Tax=Rhinatrema bivittatum TaxID=194408 RepID=UPI00112C9C03|nr:protein AKNAD1 [Rhinatrema bivittatum]